MACQMCRSKRASSISAQGCDGRCHGRQWRELEPGMDPRCGGLQLRLHRLLRRTRQKREDQICVRADALHCVRQEADMYSFEISAALFTSNLLVKEHFLSWLLTQLEQCGLHAFMIWFTFASSYHKSILQDISQGRHLVRALVSRIVEVCSCCMVVGDNAC